MTPPSVPSLIALDWGTSSLRASLLGVSGRILDTRSEPWGIMQVPHGDFASAFDAITAQWPRDDVNAIAAGMIGSTSGWVPAPYCAAPAGADDLAAALATVPGGRIFIVPGVATSGRRPDVMRGEETQVVGALAGCPRLATRSRLVLPGTHSKWVHVAGGRVSDFSTYMTGELFALLRDHSMLGRGAVAVPGASGPAENAFTRGVLAAQAESTGLAPLLFSARAMVLANQLAASASLEYLSGLLIGDEIRCGLVTGGRPDALVGDQALCERYVTALRVLGVPDVPVLTGAADAGLWSIACRAGLVRPAPHVT